MAFLLSSLIISVFYLMCLDQGLANYGLWDKSGMPMSLCVVNGCFNATKAEQNGCNKEAMAPNPKIVAVQPFTEKVC